MNQTLSRMRASLPPTRLEHLDGTLLTTDLVVWYLRTESEAWPAILRELLGFNGEWRIQVLGSGCDPNSSEEVVRSTRMRDFFGNFQFAFAVRKDKRARMAVACSEAVNHIQRVGTPLQRIAIGQPGTHQMICAITDSSNGVRDPAPKRQRFCTNGNEPNAIEMEEYCTSCEIELNGARKTLKEAVEAVECAKSNQIEARNETTRLRQIAKEKCEEQRRIENETSDAAAVYSRVKESHAEMEREVAILEEHASACSVRMEKARRKQRKFELNLLGAEAYLKQLKTVADNETSEIEQHRTQCFSDVSSHAKVMNERKAEVEKANAKLEAQRHKRDLLRNQLPIWLGKHRMLITNCNLAKGELARSEEAVVASVEVESSYQQELQVIEDKVKNARCDVRQKTITYTAALALFDDMNDNVE